MPYPLNFDVMQTKFTPIGSHNILGMREGLYIAFVHVFFTLVIEGHFFTKPVRPLCEGI